MQKAKRKDGNTNEIKPNQLLYGNILIFMESMILQKQTKTLWEVI